MSRVISFRDLQLIPELSKYSEIEMLHPSMDSKINACLEQLGFNISAPVFYVPNKHRDMQNNVGVGFRATGEITQDRGFLNSFLCTPVERLIAASFTDMSLARELAMLMGSRTSIFSEEESEEDDSFPDELVEPDYEEVLTEIACLEQVRDTIRGNPYNEWGSLKTAEEY